MILPISAYGAPVLRKVAAVIEPSYPGLQELVQNMFDTMYKAEGVGLAAPQVGLSVRLFVVDGSALKENDPTLESFRKVFINPVITNQSGQLWMWNEGCLSVPGIREDISRHSKIRIKYSDENFEKYDEAFDGLKARIIQHEYDHLEGVLFPDRLNPFKKRILKGKLLDITRGKIDTSYKMNFPAKKAVMF
jgi:peptide deformylase